MGYKFLVMTNKTYLIIKKILLAYIKYLYAPDVVILSKTAVPGSL